MSRSDRCCFNCCHIKWGAISVAASLILQAIVNLIFIWVTYYRGVALFVSTALLIVLLVAACLVLWAVLSSGKSWPLTFCVVVLVIMIVGCLALIISSIIDAMDLGDCETRRTRPQYCQSAKAAYAINIVSCIICICLYIWFIYILVRAKQWLEATGGEGGEGLYYQVGPGRGAAGQKGAKKGGHKFRQGTTVPVALQQPCVYQPSTGYYGYA